MPGANSRIAKSHDLPDAEGDEEERDRRDGQVAGVPKNQEQREDTQPDEQGAGGSRTSRIAETGRDEEAEPNRCQSRVHLEPAPGVPTVHYESSRTRSERHTTMRVGPRVLGPCLLCVAAACFPAGEPPQSATSASWFEGARLITGDGGAPIERAAFLVEDGAFAWVGRQGEREPPDGAARVDLSGQSVIPALIDAHQHIGLTDVNAGTHSQDNYTRDNLVEHLERSAYHGIAATMSLGLEADEALAFRLRDEVVPHATRFLTSGRGIAGAPMAGPQQPYRLAIPRGARTEAEGRAAVDELHAHGVDLVKIWVDDRGGTVPKLEPPVYRAIIDAAHAHGMQVAAHVGTTSALEDAKDLLRAGIDGFAHTVRDRDVDEEYLALVGQYPDVWTIPNLPGSPVARDDLPWLSETLPPFEIENLRGQIERAEATGPSQPGDQFPLQCRNLARNHEVGMIIGLGTDSGTSVAWTTHTELRDMVACGLSPMEAIVAATRTNARILGLERLGTVAVGKRASFVVLDANPLDDINNTRRIAVVYLGGVAVDRERLRAGFMDGVQ